MSLLRGLILLTLACLASAASITRRPDPVTDGTELVFAFMTHRHGDRTPISSSLSYLGLDDYSEVEALIEPWGYGQLTDVGKRTGYNTGKFIRRRYDGLLADKFNKSEIYIRSTDSTRTKMTVLTAMSAVYPAGDDSWSDYINWVPIPYTTMPVKYDYNEASINCPTFTTAYATAYLSNNSRMDPYADLLATVSDIIGIDITSTPVEILSVYDVYVSVKSLGYDISTSIEEIWDDMKEAAGVAWDIILGDDQYLYLEAGPFLNEFFTYADEIINGTDTPRVRVYSAHDTNVYSLESIARAEPRQGAPKYGSLFSLELRRVTSTGEYVVLPVYLTDPNEGIEKYLQVNGCGDSVLCDYETYRSLTADYVLDEDDWRTACGFTNDLEIDTSSID